MSLETLQYPVGRFVRPANVTEALLKAYISDISTFPERLSAAVQSLSDEQLDTAYRPGGWTVRQVVNHCADSHMNAMIRLKLALTEDQPTIKPYDQDSWAALPDSLHMPVGPALQMLEGIHARWTMLLRNMSTEDFSRTFVHPEYGTVYRLDENTGLYAWHCNHHLGHITALIKAKNWN